ncbi:AAA family ATPase [Epilithonimonas sp.]|uniref:ATP-dependent nuclease n=1 Tax=Epilithonimonas sp. TaxID=2894511 RepID=UPI0028A1DA0F|nr:AAA family ATPase [Epilithonimonas sp.]
MKSDKTLLIQFTDYCLEENNEIKKLEYLPFVNKINILIGSNNSGKSKFMRKVMDLENLHFINEIDYKLVSEVIDDVNENIYKQDYLQKLPRSSYIETVFINNTSSDHNIRRRLNTQDVKLTYSIDHPKMYFIPTLRTAHSLYLKTQADNYNRANEKFKKIEDDIFLFTLNQNYNLSKKVEIFTGNNLYNEILDARNSKRDVRKRFEALEKFVGRNFFGKAIDIVADFAEGRIRIHIEGEEDRFLHELGDGIQALIILVYKIFLAEENSFIFIDEPEINLHPGMQRLFLEQINSNPDLLKKNLTYFISTHSNHFLDLTLEKDNVSIYSFYSKAESDGDKKLIIKNVNSGDNEILKNIGVNNSSVFMANCSIWVEGVSDRIYIRTFLKSYCESLGLRFPKEDIDFAFFEYAGTNLDHYFFGDNIVDEVQNEIISDIRAMALSNRIFLLADSDNASLKSKKGIRLKKLKDAKSPNFIPYIIGDYREVENLLPFDIWNAVLKEFCNKNISAEYQQEISHRIEIALGKLQSKDYKKKYIGEFLNDVRLEVGEISGKMILNESEYKKLSNGTFGTLTNKRWLSEIVAEKDLPWDIFRQNKSVEKLTKDVYDFIMKK